MSSRRRCHLINFIVEGRGSTPPLSMAYATKYGRFYFYYKCMHFYRVNTKAINQIT